jgi:SAM-dependent methyltransferase
VKSHSWLRLGYRFLAQIVDPIRSGRGIRGLGWYTRDFRAYRRAASPGALRFADAIPALHDRSASHEIDAHYFYVNAWAMRRILGTAPARHVDVASQTVLASLLSAVLPVTFYDYRRLRATLDNLACEQGDIVDLDIPSDSVQSLSCLHVAEHIGLGRYGDPIDPDGTRRAARELTRVLAPGGTLYFALPVGVPRVCFNAHRIHDARTICDYFSGLELVEYSGVHDDGRFVERVELATFDLSDYACGMFVFRKPAAPASRSDVATIPVSES